MRDDVYYVLGAGHAALARFARAMSSSVTWPAVLLEPLLVHS